MSSVEVLRPGAGNLRGETLGRLFPGLAPPLEVMRGLEAALMESNSRFGALTSNLPGMVFQIQNAHNDLTLLFVSEGSIRVLGASPDKLLAQPELLLDSLIPA